MARNLPTLVFASRRRCGVSRRMDSIVAWIEVTRRNDLRVVKLDVDRSSEIALRLGVHTTPTLVLLRDGSIVGRLEGRATGKQIVSLLAVADIEADSP